MIIKNASIPKPDRERTNTMLADGLTFDCLMVMKFNGRSMVKRAPINLLDILEHNAATALEKTIDKYAHKLHRLPVGNKAMVSRVFNISYPKWAYIIAIGFVRTGRNEISVEVAVRIASDRQQCKFFHSLLALKYRKVWEKQ